MWQDVSTRPANGRIPPSRTCYGDLGEGVDRDPYRRLAGRICIPTSSTLRGIFKGGYGFHPLFWCGCDNTGELLAIICRPGKRRVSTPPPIHIRDHRRRQIDGGSQPSGSHKPV